jgi:hypothetical protein
MKKEIILEYKCEERLSLEREEVDERGHCSGATLKLS